MVIIMSVNDNHYSNDHVYDHDDNDIDDNDDTDDDQIFCNMQGRISNLVFRWWIDLMLGCVCRLAIARVWINVREIC